MITNTYLKWLSTTQSCWWNDSADWESHPIAIENGCTGVTTNPLLVKRSLYCNPDFWRPYLSSAKHLTGDAKVEEIIRCITIQIAKLYEGIFHETEHVQGYVCAQVDPKAQGDAKAMVQMGRRLAAWAPNIAVKLPATAAGLRAIEQLASEGITTVGTVSFTVAQAVAIGEAQQKGMAKCRKEGKTPGKAFSVIMVGRLDDYLRDVIHDLEVAVPEEAIKQAGTACIKKAYAIFRKRGYEAKLMPAGMRGGYHATALAGADMSMSLSAGIHTALAKETEYIEHIDESIAQDIIDLLCTVQEFRKAYGLDYLSQSEFITYGVSQRTLSQFVEAGWNPIADFEI